MRNCSNLLGEQGLQSGKECVETVNSEVIHQKCITALRISSTSTALDDHHPGDLYLLADLVDPQWRIAKLYQVCHTQMNIVGYIIMTYCRTCRALCRGGGNTVGGVGRILTAYPRSSAFLLWA